MSGVPDPHGRPYANGGLSIARSEGWGRSPTTAHKGWRHAGPCRRGQSIARRALSQALNESVYSVQPALEFLHRRRVRKADMFVCPKRLTWDNRNVRFSEQLF